LECFQVTYALHVYIRMMIGFKLGFVFRDSVCLPAAHFLDDRLLGGDMRMMTFVLNEIFFIKLFANLFV